MWGTAVWALWGQIVGTALGVSLAYCPHTGRHCRRSGDLGHNTVTKPRLTFPGRLSGSPAHETARPGAVTRRAGEYAQESNPQGHRRAVFMAVRGAQAVV